MVDGGTRLTEGISLNRRKILYAPEKVFTLYGYGVIACLLIEEAYACKSCLPTCSV